MNDFDFGDSTARSQTEARDYAEMTPGEHDKAARLRQRVRNVCLGALILLTIF